MPSTRLLWVGDLHIGGLGSYFPNHKNPNKYIYKALTQACEYAREEGIKHVIVPGDVFDSPYPTQEEIIEFVQFTIAYIDLEFIIYPGNHDYESSQQVSLELMHFINKLGATKNVRLFMEPTAIKVDGVPVQILPWPHHKRLKGPPSLILAHVTVQGVKMNSGYKSRSSIVIEPKKDFWVIGDIHERHEFHERILYPGLMYQTNFGEKAGKGFTVLDVSYSEERGIRVKHKRHIIEAPFTLRNVVISSVEDLETVDGSDASIRYKLFIKADVRLPDNFLAEHPNVIWHTPFKNKAQLSMMQQGEAFAEFLEDATDTVKDTQKMITRGLRTYLQSREWDDKKIKRAYGIVKRIVAELSEGKKKEAKHAD